MSLKFFTDFQCSDGCSMLLKYVTIYVTKTKDFTISKGLIFFSLIFSVVDNAFILLCKSFSRCRYCISCIMKHIIVYSFLKHISTQIINRLRAYSLVVSDSRSETKGSRFEYGCYLCAEVSSLQ